MRNWEEITGTTAIQVAERANYARPGTFSAAAIKWTADGKPPFSVKITGILDCGGCGASSEFSLDARTASLSCAGCGNMYSLVNIEQTIDGKDGRVIFASFFSRRAGTSAILPTLHICDVANEEGSTPDEKVAAVRVLGARDCGDRNKVKAFVDGGGDINARDPQQWTALHRAAFRDDVESVRILLEFGADPNLPVLPGSSKRTVEIVRNNGQPNASQIEALLTSGRRPRAADARPSQRTGSPRNKTETPGKRWWAFWK